MKNVEVSSKDLALSLNNVAASGTALFMSFERIQNSQVALDRANLMVQRSTESLDQATKHYNETVEKYGVNSAEAKDASDKLSIAQQALQVSEERADMAQRNMNNTMIQTAVTVIPNVITMVASLSKALGGLSGMSETISGISSSVSGGLGATGIGGGVGGGLTGLGSAALGGTAAVAILPLALDFSGRQAQAIAQNPNLQGLMTIKGGGAMPTGTNPWTSSISQVGQSSSGPSALGTFPGVTWQHGGIVTKPTFGLVGEAGPEAIIPLNKLGGGGDVYATFYVQGSIDKATADYLEERLKNVIVDASSSHAPVTHRSVRFGS